LLGDSDPVPFGASLFAQRRLFAECGGYDEALWRVCGRHALGAEDAEFGLRLRRLGIPIGYCREALVVHPVHTDRLALGRQVALAYHYGWREPLLFFDPRRRLWERYRWRRAFAYAASAGRDLCLGDRAGAAAGLVEVARSAGGIVARWSPAYRRWAVLTRQRGV
jgi:GT2 family glycosyltransferase